MFLIAPHPPAQCPFHWKKDSARVCWPAGQQTLAETGCWGWRCWTVEYSPRDSHQKSYLNLPATAAPATVLMCWAVATAVVLEGALKSTAAGTVAGGGPSASGP